MQRKGLGRGILLQGVLKGGRESGRNANTNERSRGCSPLPGHGTISTSKVGGWRLVAVGRGWQLAVGGPWGRSLRAVHNKKNSGFLKTPLSSCATAYAAPVHTTCGTPAFGADCRPPTGSRRTCPESPPPFHGETAGPPESCERGRGAWRCTLACAGLLKGMRCVDCAGGRANALPCGARLKGDLRRLRASRRWLRVTEGGWRVTSLCPPTCARRILRNSLKKKSCLLPLSSMPEIFSYTLCRKAFVVWLTHVDQRLAKGRKTPVIPQPPSPFKWVGRPG